MASQFGTAMRIPAVTLGVALAPLVTQDCEVDAVSVYNGDAADRTVVVKDGNGKTFEGAFPVPAGTRQTIPLSAVSNGVNGEIQPQGVFFRGGIWMSGSAAAVLDVWLVGRV